MLFGLFINLFRDLCPLFILLEEELENLVQIVLLEVKQHVLFLVNSHDNEPVTH